MIFLYKYKKSWNSYRCCESSKKYEILLSFKDAYTGFLASRIFEIS